jgi:biopolymer transport protein ExbD
MSFLAELAGQRRFSTESEELSIVPVMNMFLILIPFLVSMAVFAHVAVIDVSLPPEAGLGQGPKKNDLKLTVAMQAAGFQVVLGDSLLAAIPYKNDRPNYIALDSTLRAARPTLTHQEEAVVAVADGIIFEKVVAVMDVCREAGFAKLGLSGAPEENTTTETQRH